MRNLLDISKAIVKLSNYQETIYATSKARSTPIDSDTKFKSKYEKNPPLSDIKAENPVYNYVDRGIK